MVLGGRYTTKIRHIIREHRMATVMTMHDKKKPTTENTLPDPAREAVRGA